MTRVILIVVVAVMGVFSVGCQCTDGYNTYKYLSRTSYRACDRSCETEFGSHDEGVCGCSTQCPCWK